VKRIGITIADAWAAQLAEVSRQIDEGTTLGSLLEGLPPAGPGATIGVWGRRVAMDHVLRDGDRVEIYRPLLADPKESRRHRAKAGRR
jgi:putative ubiquitin-RnfH superfamily antitoxin RatB of RatAB toxin-antitoxin module